MINRRHWNNLHEDPYRAWGRHLYAQYSTIHRYGNVKSDGFSVRCVKDE